ncbi:hypothetical protein KGF54_005441 [Candida jiufengensis]|uniref:uncharacterized protein n=1 Tax=Candida jiufengensis TaxID=497108 RepID=UPI002224C52C|nr:uncharacterized protein KGF54_005441 [Candida jiufengensis]KAI5949564.1 hypothetical protein KGF54_005441 [Candida jiufengensis]
MLSQIHGFDDKNGNSLTNKFKALTEKFKLLKRKVKRSKRSTKDKLQLKPILKNPKNPNFNEEIDNCITEAHRPFYEFIGKLSRHQIEKGDENKEEAKETYRSEQIKNYHSIQ